MQPKRLQTLGTVLFLLGLFPGLALAVAGVWGDYEGMSYFNSGAGYEPFNGLNCPVLMTHSGPGVIAARFDNPGNDQITPYYEIEVSGPSSNRQWDQSAIVPGHSSRTVYWPVDVNDIDLGFFIFVKMDVLPVGGHSTREATCGIIVLNLKGVQGDVIFALTLGISLLAMVTGLAVRENAIPTQTNRAQNVRNAMRAAGISTAIAMYTSILGWWAIGMLFCAITVLLLLILLRMGME